MSLKRLLCIPAAAALAVGVIALPAAPVQAAPVSPHAWSLYDIYTGIHRLQDCMADGRAGLHVDWSAFECQVYHDGAHEALFVMYL